MMTSHIIILNAKKIPKMWWILFSGIILSVLIWAYFRKDYWSQKQIVLSSSSSQWYVMVRPHHTPIILDKLKAQQLPFQGIPLNRPLRIFQVRGTQSQLQQLYENCTDIIVKLIPEVTIQG